MIHDIQSAQFSQKQNGCNIYAIMKTMPMWTLGYHTMDLRQVMHLGTWYTVQYLPKCFSWHKAIEVITGRTHCFHDCIYIYIYIYIIHLSIYTYGYIYISNSICVHMYVCIFLALMYWIREKHSCICERSCVIYLL